MKRIAYLLLIALAAFGVSTAGTALVLLFFVRDL